MMAPLVQDAGTVLTSVDTDLFWSKGSAKVFLSRDGGLLVGSHRDLEAFQKANPSYKGWDRHHIVEEVHLRNLGVRDQFASRNDLPSVLLPPEAHSDRINSILRKADVLTKRGEIGPWDLYEQYYVEAYDLLPSMSEKAALLRAVRRMLRLDKESLIPR